MKTGSYMLKISDAIWNEKMPKIQGLQRASKESVPTIFIREPHYKLTEYK